jgi:aspartate carbamoyltransferase catalytic subunit
VYAGDGRHAHPTLALLDLATLLRHVPGGSLRGHKVVILGDVLHSRVARSNLWTLTAAGADVWLCGPATLLRGFKAWAAAGVGGERRFTVTTDMAAALRDANAVMALRIQKERMAAGLLPSLHEYAARFGLTRERLATAAEGCVVMHPGPVNEGIEIASDVANGPQSLVTEQVATGVAMRMAVLSLVTSVGR